MNIAGPVFFGNMPNVAAGSQYSINIGIKYCGILISGTADRTVDATIAVWSGAGMIKYRNSAWGIEATCYDTDIVLTYVAGDHRGYLIFGIE